MQNVVSLRSDPSRPPRPLARTRAGAQILLFTGVRYCREADAVPPGPERVGALSSAGPVDAATR